MLNFVILLELLAVLKCNLFFIGSLNSTASTVYIRPTATVVVTMNASKLPQPSQRTSLPNHKTSVKGIEKFLIAVIFVVVVAVFLVVVLLFVLLLLLLLLLLFCWYCCCCYCCCCCCYIFEHAV